MKKFNVCKNFVTVLNGMPIPKGAFYGKDRIGVWVCVETEPNSPIELYRWQNMRGKCEWTLCKEGSSTTDFIKETAAKYSLWNRPIEYPKYTGIHAISEDAARKGRTTQSTKSQAKSQVLKRGFKRYEERHKDMIPLDKWEKWVSKTR